MGLCRKGLTPKEDWKYAKEAERQPEITRLTPNNYLLYMAHTLLAAQRRNSRLILFFC